MFRVQGLEFRVQGLGSLSKPFFPLWSPSCIKKRELLLLGYRESSKMRSWGLGPWENMMNYLYNVYVYRAGSQFV